MKVAIIGSRELNGSEESCYLKICENVPKNCTEIVSGGADGIDELARKFARENSLLFTRFDPEYHKYMKSATLVRNIQIIEYAHLVLAFWNGKSRGTAHVIEKCYETNKDLKIFYI